MVFLRVPSSVKELSVCLFVSISQQFFIPPLNISVSTCPYYPNEEVQNIWEGSGSNKLPIGEHQVQAQGLSVLL